MGSIERPLLLALASSALACQGTEQMVSGSTDASSASTVTADSTSSVTTSTSSSTDPMTTGGVGCPNGILEGEEVCDDGNMIDGDGCNNDCTESGILIREYRSQLPGSDEVRDVAVDNQGGIIAVGGQGSDRWAACFDSQLAPVWSKTYDLAPAEKFLSVAVGTEDIFVTGGLIPVLGNDPKTLDRTAWTGRLTSAGEIVWEDNWVNDLGDVYATQLSIADNGDIIIAGLMSVPNDSLGMFARRYTANGDALWTTNHPINFNNQDSYPLGPGLAVSPDAIQVGWGIWGAGVVDETVVAFPPGGGAPLWTQAVSDTDGVVYSLARASNGDIVVGSIGNGFMAMTARRLSSTGASLWSSDACTGRGARAVTIDASGDIVVIGDGPGAVGDNIRLCKFTPDGSLRWGRDIDGGTGDDRGFSVATLPSGRIVAGGNVNVGPNETDAWIAIYSP